MITEEGIRNAHPLPLKYWPDPILSVPCERLEEDVEVRTQIAEAMIATMRLHDGVGLAAPQIGILKKICVVEVDRGNPVVIINPTLLEWDDPNDTFKYEEGCLSIPGYFETRYRNSNINLTYETISGDTCTTRFQFLEAFAVQHELDHLQGKLFIDGLSNLKLQRVRKKVKKALKI